jgi:hypothetical protein
MSETDSRCTSMKCSKRLSVCVLTVLVLLLVLSVPSGDAEEGSPRMSFWERQ